MLAILCSRVVNDGVMTPAVTPCLCDSDGNSSQEGSGDGASPWSITPCSCIENNDSGSGSDDGAIALLVVPCLCGGDSGSGMQEGRDNGTLASPIFPLTTAAAALKMVPRLYQSSLACATTAGIVGHPSLTQMRAQHDERQQDSQPARCKRRWRVLSISNLEQQQRTDQ